MNEVAFELAKPSNYVEECPGCDAMLACNKKDYFLSNFRQVLKKVCEVTCNHYSETVIRSADILV